MRIRYRHEPARAEVRPMEGFVHFQEGQRAIAPGQAAVVYQGEEVLWRIHRVDSQV